MTSHPSHRPVSALRARMIEDMTVRGFTEKTRNDYVATCGRLPPSSAGPPTLRRRRICAASSCTRRRSACSRRASTVRSRPCASLHRDARPAGPCPAAHHRARTAPAAGGAERRGGHAAAAGGAGAEVQGGARHRRSLSPGRPKAGPVGRRTARLRGGRAQARRHRLRAHAAAGRARQGSYKARVVRTATPSCRRSCSSCCASPLPQVPGRGGEGLARRPPGRPAAGRLFPFLVFTLPAQIAAIADQNKLY